MAKFRYYITDLIEGCLVGTDNSQTAEDFSHSEEHFVLDSKTGEWMTSSGRREVKEA